MDSTPHARFAEIDDFHAPRLARIAAWTLLLVCAPLTALHFFSTPPDWLRTSGTGALSMVACATLLLLQLDRARAAFLTIVIGGWMATNLVVAGSGGLYSSNIAIYPMIIIITGLFLGDRSCYLVAGLTLGVGLLFALSHLLGGLPPVERKPVIFPLATIFSVVTISTLATWFFSRALQDRLNRLQKETAHREFAESIAQEKHQQLVEIADNVPGVVYQFVSRTNGTRGFTYVGARAKEVFGLSDDPARFEANFIARIHKDDLDAFLAANQAGLESPRPWSFEGRFHKPATEESREGVIWFRAESRPSIHRGEVVFSGLLSDITARREAELELAQMHQRLASMNSELETRVSERTAELSETATRLQQIIETLDSALIVWSADRTLLLWNQAFIRMFPATAQSIAIGASRETIGQQMRASSELGSADDPANHWDTLGKSEVHLPNGKILEINRLATASGGRLVLHSDIAELRRHREMLARNERMAALGNLVAGVAHEINTPLGNALMVSSTLDDHLKEFDKLRKEGPLRRSTFDEFIGRVHESNDQLLRNLRRATDLILHFKQVAVDQTSDRRRKFDLAEVLDDIRATVANRVRKTGHELDIVCPSGIEMDSYPGALGQIVTNLVENAIIHGFEHRPHGSMRIDVDYLDETQLRIDFSDNGQGIPEAYLSRIFDPFFTTRLGRGGSGLGLSIVLNLARDGLGGDVSVDSTPGQGTRFSFRIPRVAPARAEA